MSLPARPSRERRPPAPARARHDAAPRLTAPRPPSAFRAAASAAAPGAPDAGLRNAAPARSAAARARALARTADVLRDELPLIVAGRTLVFANGRLGALAVDAHDPAACPLGPSRHGDRSGAASGLQAPLPAGSAAAPLRPGLRGLLPEVAGHEVRPCDRVLPLLPDEASLHEHVEARRVDARAVLPLVKLDAPDPLLAAEGELRLLLAPGLMPPDGHGDAHEDRHDRHAHQQCRHRVAALAALTP